ncbi:unnamed protein product [Sphenostylis stenocarpa]|uniref:Uncharacterized protein n=1 Tax=Sphenostylis stenocarpa TaxID=92480 RepID=A0AA86RVW0_9FABA|nr:unnamed protein product [Sphenostylis stenocarpa]
MEYITVMSMSQVTAPYSWCTEAYNADIFVKTYICEVRRNKETGSGMSRVKVKCEGEVWSYRCRDCCVVDDEMGRVEAVALMEAVVFKVYNDGVGSLHSLSSRLVFSFIRRALNNEQLCNHI